MLNLKLRHEYVCKNSWIPANEKLSKPDPYKLNSDKQQEM